MPAAADPASTMGNPSSRAPAASVSAPWVARALPVSKWSRRVRPTYPHSDSSLTQLRGASAERTFGVPSRPFLYPLGQYSGNKHSELYGWLPLQCFLCLLPVIKTLSQIRTIFVYLFCFVLPRCIYGEYNSFQEGYISVLGLPKHYHKLEGLKKHMFIVPHFWKLEVQNSGKWARLVSSGASEGGSVLCLSPSVRRLLVIPGISWLVDVSFQSLTVFTWCSLLSICFLFF